MLRLAALLAVGALAAPVWPAPKDPMALTRFAGLTPETHEFVLLHVHAHLDVFFNGKRVVVPAGIGIDTHNPAVRKFPEPDGTTGYGGINPPCSKPCISPLHTHSDDGILHTEAKKNEFNRLGQFFKEWKVRLSARCIGTFCKPKQKIAVYVDGKPLKGDPRFILLKDKREIAIVIGKSPAQIPSKFPGQLFWQIAERAVLRTPLRHTLLTAPPTVVTSADEAAFDRLLRTLDEGETLEYDAAAPKHVFLRYLLDRRPVLLHGTGDPEVDRFEPQRQTDYDNEWTNAVFATDDPIWPIFFAVVNRPVARSLINACSRRYGESHYYFSIGTDPKASGAWRSGWIYVLPRETFRVHPSGPEWLSPVAVCPLARLRVEPADFPFIEDVVQHTLGEPVGRAVVRATLGRALRR